MSEHELYLKHKDSLTAEQLKEMEEVIDTYNEAIIKTFQELNMKEYEHKNYDMSFTTKTIPPKLLIT